LGLAGDSVHQIVSWSWLGFYLHLSMRRLIGDLISQVELGE